MPRCTPLLPIWIVQRRRGKNIIKGNLMKYDQENTKWKKSICGILLIITGQFMKSVVHGVPSLI